METAFKRALEERAKWYARTEPIIARTMHLLTGDVDEHRVHAIASDILRTDYRDLYNYCRPQYYIMDQRTDKVLGIHEGLTEAIEEASDILLSGKCPAGSLHINGRGYHILVERIGDCVVTEVWHK